MDTIAGGAPQTDAATGTDPSLPNSTDAAPLVSGPPPEGTRVPLLVHEMVDEADVIKPIWQNALGGLTFRVKPGRATPCSPEYFSAGAVRFVKYQPPAAAQIAPLSAEVDRLKWAKPFTSVPAVVDYVHSDDGEEVLVTSQIMGRPATHPYWRARPAEAAFAIGDGLRDLHDALPVAECPFSWRVADRVAALPADVAEKLRQDAPPEDDLVVCHGDARAPNTLISNFGHLAGHVGLGKLGVADRWADLAIASWSVGLNFGEQYVPEFFRGYGVEPDAEAIEYYRRLWDACDVKHELQFVGSLD